ncbi:MAG: hypothetical protein ACE5G0_02965 [Rhodothermales bacterium]
MRFLIISMGPGETAQGAAFARYALAAGHDVSMGVLVPETLRFIDDLDAPKSVIRTGTEARNEIERGGFDVVVFISSKAFKSDPDFQNTPPKNRPLACSLDSNWLFDHPRWFPCIQWLDTIFLNFPPRIYRYGLKEHGGFYQIPAHLKPRLMPVGLVPSYPPLEARTRAEIRHRLGVQDHHALIFSYFGFSMTYHADFYGRYLRVMEALDAESGGRLRVIHFGHERPQAPWLVPVERTVGSRRYFDLLASSDLVFQHQGLGTLQQAMSAHVPAVVNVPPPRRGVRHTLAAEVEPFARAGVCTRHFFDDPLDQVLDSMRTLLFSPESRAAMVREQKNHYSVGEKTMLQAIEAGLRMPEALPNGYQTRL